MNIKLVLFLSILAVVKIYGAEPIPQKDDAVGRLVVVALSGEKTGDTQTVLRYKLSDAGVLSESETLFRSLTEDVRFDSGNNRLLARGRYLADNWGNIIDLLDGSLRRHERDSHDGFSEELYYAQENRAIYRLINDRNILFYSYDPETDKEINLLSARNSCFTGTGVVPSPDYKSAAAPGCGEKSNGLWSMNTGLRLLQNQRSRILLRDASANGASFCSSIPYPPIAWVNNRQLLTQRHDGLLVLVDLNGKIKPLAPVASTERPAESCAPELRRDASGKIIYQWGKYSYIVDLKLMKLVSMEWHDLGDDFEVSVDWDKEHRYIYRYQGKEIGRWWSFGWEARTAPGHIAVRTSKKQSSEDYDFNIIQVWIANSKTWQALPEMWISEMVGWSE